MRFNIILLPGKMHLIVFINLWWDSRSSETTTLQDIHIHEHLATYAWSYLAITGYSLTTSNSQTCRAPPMVLAHRLAVRMALPGVQLRSAFILICPRCEYLQRNFGVGDDYYGRSPFFLPGWRERRGCEEHLGGLWPCLSSGKSNGDYNHTFFF